VGGGGDGKRVEGREGGDGRMKKKSCYKDGVLEKALPETEIR
jgi:hypothetical protein